MRPHVFPTLLVLLKGVLLINLINYNAYSAKKKKKKKLITMPILDGELKNFEKVDNFFFFIFT